MRIINEMQMTRLISGRKPNIVLINKKKRTCQLEVFTIPADHRVRMKVER